MDTTTKLFREMLDTSYEELRGIGYLSLPQVAGIFGVDARTIKRWVKEGHLPAPSLLGRSKVWSLEVLHYTIERLAPANPKPFSINDLKDPRTYNDDEVRSGSAASILRRWGLAKDGTVAGTWIKENGRWVDINTMPAKPMTGKAGGASYHGFKVAGWTDELLVAVGCIKEAVPVAP